MSTFLSTDRQRQAAKTVREATTLSLIRRAYGSGVRPGLIGIDPNTDMAWRPYENLINGELDNTTPKKVTGWMRFFRSGSRPLRVTFDLVGDFHEDIRGKIIRLKNSEPSDRNHQLDRKDTYMEGFSAVQKGKVGDITAGLSLGTWTEELTQKLMTQHELFWDELGIQGAKREERRREYTELYRRRIEAKALYYPYVEYPYIEWYSETNGRVVLGLDSSQVEIVDSGEVPRREKTPEELAEDAEKRDKAMANFMEGMVKSLSRENRKKGGDGKVFGAVISKK